MVCESARDPTGGFISGHLSQLPSGGPTGRWELRPRLSGTAAPSLNETRGNDVLTSAASMAAENSVPHIFFEFDLS